MALAPLSAFPKSEWPSSLAACSSSRGPGSRAAIPSSPLVSPRTHWSGNTTKSVPLYNTSDLFHLRGVRVALLQRPHWRHYADGSCADDRGDCGVSGNSRVGRQVVRHVPSAARRRYVYLPLHDPRLARDERDDLRTIRGTYEVAAPGAVRAPGA